MLARLARPSRGVVRSGRWISPRPSLMFAREAKISASDLRKDAVVPGSAIGHPVDRLLRIEEFTRGKAGKGGGFIQVTMRDMKSGTSYKHKFNTSDRVEIVELENPSHFMLLYKDDDFMYLMEEETMDQIEIPLSMIDKQQVRWLQDGMRFKVYKYEGSPLRAVPPAKATLEVTEASTALQGDNNKFVSLENGERIRAPNYVQMGQRVNVNISDGTFDSRADN